MSPSTSIIATWDDHEVDNNWSFEENFSEQFLSALSAFRNAFPQRIGTEGGIWRNYNGAKHWKSLCWTVVLNEGTADISQRNKCSGSKMV